MKAAIVLALVLAVPLAACGKGDVELDAAIAAGKLMNDTAQKCIDHVKANKGDTKIPECNASKQHAAYLEAKTKVRSPSPALEAIDQRSAQLRLEAISLLSRPRK